MSTMGERLYRTEGVILKRIDVGEADRIVTILTPQGKLTATARGVRKTASKLSGHLELLSHCQLQLAQGKQRDVLTQSIVVARFDALQQQLVRMAAGYYVAEITDALTIDEDAAAHIFTLCLETLHALTTVTQVEMVLHWYTMQLCDAVGYRPQLVDCVVCGNVLDQRAHRWSAVQGGMLCPDCHRSDIQAVSLSLAVFKLLRIVQREGLAAVQGVHVAPEVHSQVFQVMRRWVMRQSERPLRSASFLDDVRLLPSS
jgi:DNA repair protein RecO (recombination protein O)